MDIECELKELMDNIAGEQQFLIYEAIRRIGTLDYILGILEAKEKAS